jgi:hypothetical protein
MRDRVESTHCTIITVRTDWQTEAADIVVGCPDWRWFGVTFKYKFEKSALENVIASCHVEIDLDPRVNYST